MNIYLCTTSRVFLPPSFGATKFTFCSRQIFCMPGRLRSDGDDAGQDRRMFVEACRANDISSESTLVN